MDRRGRGLKCGHFDQPGPAIAQLSAPAWEVGPKIKANIRGLGTRRALASALVMNLCLISGTNFHLLTATKCLFLALS